MKKILDVRHFIILILLGLCVFLYIKKPKKEIVLQQVPSKPELIHDTSPQEVPVYLQGETILKVVRRYVTAMKHECKH